MGTEPEKPQKETPAPGTAVRLAWWFGIYIAAQIPLVVYAFDQQGIDAIGYALFEPFYFPLILGFILAPFANLLPDSYATFTGPCLMIAGYAFYLWHLIQTIKAKNRCRFDLLLLLLVAVVFLNQMIIGGMERANGN
jgi:hypothetical protein